MEIPRLSLQRPTPSSSCSEFLTTDRLRRMRGRGRGRRSGLRKGLRSSPLSAARHPLSRQQIRAVIYVCLSGEALKKKKKPKTSLGRFHPRGIFRPQACGVGERRRATQPWAARSSRLRVPLGDTGSWEGQAREGVCPGRRASGSLMGRFTSASAARSALSASGLSLRIKLAPRRINSKN